MPCTPESIQPALNAAVQSMRGFAPRSRPVSVCFLETAPTAQGRLRTKHLGYRIARRRANSQPLERSVASTALTNDHAAPESATAHGDKRPFNGAIDPLLPLSFTLPTAAMSREQSFSRRSSTGAFGHLRKFAGRNSHAGNGRSQGTTDVGGRRNRHEEFPKAGVQ